MVIFVVSICALFYSPCISHIIIRNTVMMSIHTVVVLLYLVYSEQMAVTVQPKSDLDELSVALD